MDSDPEAGSNVIGDQDTSLGVSGEPMDQPPPYSSFPPSSFKKVMLRGPDLWDEDSYVSSRESKRHPPQGGGSQNHSERSFASNDSHKGEESIFLSQRSMRRPTEDLQPHRRSSTKVLTRDVLSQKRASEREGPASEDIGRRTEETTNRKPKFSICGSNHRNRFWFSVLLAWLAFSSAMYTIFAEEWINVGGNVIDSISCDVIAVDFLSTLEGIPGWSIIVGLEMSLFDSSYPTEDVETIEDYLVVKQEEINSADESFCNAVANVAVMQLVTTAFFLVAAVVLLGASFSPELRMKYTSSVRLGRAGGVVVILGMLMQIAVCLTLVFMVYRINSRLDTYLGNIFLNLDLLDEYLSHLENIPFFENDLVDTLRSVVELLATKFDTGATFIYAIMTAGLGFLAALGLCLNAAYAGDGILRCCSPRPSPAPVESSPSPTSDKFDQED